MKINRSGDFPWFGIWLLFIRVLFYAYFHILITWHIFDFIRKDAFSAYIINRYVCIMTRLRFFNIDFIGRQASLSGCNVNVLYHDIHSFANSDMRGSIGHRQLLSPVGLVVGLKWGDIVQVRDLLLKGVQYAYLLRLEFWRPWWGCWRASTPNRLQMTYGWSRLTPAELCAPAN